MNVCSEASILKLNIGICTKKFVFPLHQFI